VVGAGRIGKELLRMARTFDLKLIAADPYVNTVELGYVGARKVDLETAMRESDFIVACPLLNDETRHLIGGPQFALMKPTAFFINVSRGPVVDEPALIAALQSGTFAGAALDVFEQEPVDPANPLLAMDNVILTPHTSWSSTRVLDRSVDLFCENLRRFEQLLRQELERRQIERTEALPPARPLNELDRALPTGPLQDLASVHKVVTQLKRRLKTQGQEHRGVRRHAHVDVRRTMRASLETGGVPVVLKYRPVRPRRPELFVICDVSTSVTSASVFFLSVMHALHDSFRKMRSFVFIERVSEVTDVFHKERDFKAVSEAIGRDAGVADISGYTDYGRVWRELREQIEDELHPRATVIVLGDARTNGRDPGAETFARIAEKAGRTYWLNPEPRLYWNYGDSVIKAYEQYCEAFECWTTSQLEDFVKALTSPDSARR